MIKRLRTRFILLSMSALFLVLTLIAGGINLLSYRSVIKDADAVLEILRRNNGKFPKPDSHRDGSFPKPASPELPYESRYFSVLLDGKGGLISVDTGKIAAVDSDDAAKLALTVWESGNSEGFQGAYRFVRQDMEQECRIIFLDCGRSLATLRNFFLASLSISLAGMLAVFFLILIFSGRIILPVSESYEKQKRFITDAGHELKTPLTIISADVEVLEMELGENEWLEDIRRQTDRMTSLTSDLIFLSRMEEGGKQLCMLDFPVSDVVGETAQSFQSLAKTQNKDFAVRIQPLLTLRGDEKSIQQLTSILLDNALKYSPAGGRIALTLEKRGRTIRLSVSNTTQNPISRDQLSHLFDRFYRADPSRSSRFGGYGIGLSAARAITAAHKGRITASVPEELSLAVCVVLPV